MFFLFKFISTSIKCLGKYTKTLFFLNHNFLEQCIFKKKFLTSNCAKHTAHHHKIKSIIFDFRVTKNQKKKINLLQTLKL